MKQLMVLMLMSLVLATSVLAQGQPQFVTEGLSQMQIQERVQIQEQVREQLNINCTDCNYTFRENNTMVVQERPGKFLGIAVTMRERYTLDTEGNVEQVRQNFYAFLQRFGIVQTV